MEDGFTLRDYAAALISKWWVILLTLAVATAVAIVTSSQRPPQYQVRTQLLLVSRTSEKLTSFPNVGSALSVGTLSNLALANDLLEDIIVTLRLPGSGSLATVESVAGMMTVDIKASENNKTTVLPLLTLTVRGEDPDQLKRIAETWANLFIQRNASLFASESARSFDYIQAQYDETRKALQAKNQEKLTYREKNPVDTMRGTLGAQLSLFDQFASALDSKQVTLAATHAQREELAKALEKEPRILDDSRVFIDGAVIEKAINPVYVSTKQKFIEVSTQEASLATELVEIKKKLEEYQASIVDLSAKVTTIEATQSALDAELSLLTSNRDSLAAKLQEARLAKEEQGGTIRVVESPIVPRAAIGPRRSQIFLPAGATGLLVGIVMALMVHYIQKGTLKAPPTAPARTSD